MALLLQLLCSCSMKEDRMECPCYVSVKSDTEEDCLVTFYTSGGSIIDRKTMTAEELSSGENWTKIEKGDFQVSVLQGWRDMELSGVTVLSGRRGEESAGVYCASSAEYAVEDDLTVHEALQKQYADITLDFGDASAGLYPYSLKVTSSLHSLDILTLEAAAGSYEIEPEVGSDNTAVFRMLRQSDTEPINIYMYDGITGEPVADFDLNWYILRTGYSWKAEYLSDIRVLIDFARLELTIHINDWNRVVTFSFKI